MKVSITDLAVAMDIKTKGMTLDISDHSGEERLGSMVINSRGLTWCKGKVRKGNGDRIKWENLIEFIEEHGTK